jgi:hypothetical protein
MPRKLFISLPSELRLAIYAHLLPTRNDEPTAYNIRLVCRQLKEEFDKEIIDDTKKYHDAIFQAEENRNAEFRGEDRPILPANVKPAETFKDTQHLELSIPFTGLPEYGQFDLPITTTCPYLRLVTLRPLRIVHAQDPESRAHEDGYHEIAMKITRRFEEKFSDANAMLPAIELCWGVTGRDAAANNEYTILRMLGSSTGSRDKWKLILVQGTSSEVPENALGVLWKLGKPAKAASVAASAEDDHQWMVLF